MLFFLAVLVSTGWGPSFISTWGLIQLCLDLLPLDHSFLTPEDSHILLYLRLPRVLLGCFVGAGLAVSGLCLQSLFRNPLADPGIIGISSGAALGAVIAIVVGQSSLGNNFFISLQDKLHAFFLPGFAFLAGILTMVIIYLLSQHKTKLNVHTMLLTGIAISAFAMACVGLLIHMSDDFQLRELIFWQLGSLSRAQWNDCIVATCLIGIPMIGLLPFGKFFNLFLLGDNEAKYLGMNVERIKFISLSLVTLIIATSVAFTGIISFVGLVVPHLTRLSLGSDHKSLLPFSMALGATLLLLSDTAGKMINAPAEISLGIITAFIGCPFFLFLILKQKYQ